MLAQFFVELAEKTHVIDMSCKTDYPGSLIVQRDHQRSDRLLWPHAVVRIYVGGGRKTPAYPLV